MRQSVKSVFPVPMVARRVKQVLLAAFLAVGVGLLLLVTLGVLGFHATQQSLIEIGDQEQVASQALLRMMDASRERLLILHSIHASRDPFEIEGLVQQFYAQGTEFAMARAEFGQLEVDPADVDRLTEQRQIAFEIVGLQDRVIDLVRDGEYQQAERLLIDEVHPRQNRMLQLLADVLTAISDRAYEHTVRTTQLARRVYFLMLFFGGLGVALIAGIAMFTIRYVSRTTATIEDQADKLRASLKEAAYQKLATDEHNIVSVTNAAGVITQVNDRFCKVSQYSPYELIGRNHRILKSGQHDEAFFRDMWDTISSGKVWKGEICNRRKDGQFYWVETTIVPFLDEEGLPYQYVSVRTDITRIKEAESVLLRSKEELETMVEDRTAALAYANEQLAKEIQERKKLQYELEKLATTDTLTGLSNRREFNNAMRSELRRAERYGSPLSLILLDIDHFKRINDMHGHQVGDAVLRAFAELVGGQVREQDVFARWGGEEFALLCPNTDLESAAHLADKLGSSIRGHDFPGVGRITCSLGVAQWHEGEDQADWVGRVDAALYEAKGQGRDRVVSNA